MIEAYSGSPNTPSYKDVKDFEHRKDNRTLQTWGNAGTTMTQDMIKKVGMLLKCSVRNLTKKFSYSVMIIN